MSLNFINNHDEDIWIAYSFWRTMCATLTMAAGGRRLVGFMRAGPNGDTLRK